MIIKKINQGEKNEAFVKEEIEGKTIRQESYRLADLIKCLIRKGLISETDL